jgi:hypothetical protein
MKQPFFKLFHVNDRPVLVVKIEIDFNPAIQWLYEPEGLGTCKLTHEYEGDCAGFHTRDEAFENLGQQQAEDFVQMFHEMTIEQGESKPDYHHVANRHMAIAGEEEQ